MVVLVPGFLSVVRIMLVRMIVAMIMIVPRRRRWGVIVEEDFAAAVADVVEAVDVAEFEAESVQAQPAQGGVHGRG